MVGCAGLILPLLSGGLVIPTYGLSLLLLLAYGVLGWKIYRYRRQVYDDCSQHARLYAAYCTLSKLPQMVGQFRYQFNRLRRKDAVLIEYKGDAPVSSAPS